MRGLSTAVMILIVIGSTLGCPKAPKTVDTQPPVDNRNTNYQPGAGVAINTIKAGKRTAAMHDFDQLKTIIYAMELENNRMPSKEELRTELSGNGKNLLKLIDDGAILVPTQPRKDGLWAYEIDAEKAGGIVVVAGNVSRATADDAKKLIAQK